MKEEVARQAGRASVHRGCEESRRHATEWDLLWV